MRHLAFLVVASTTAACNILPDSRTSPPPPTAPREAAPATTLGTAGRSAEALDRTSDADRATATRVSSGGQALGTTVATLGDPGEQGFWLKTALVTSEGPGRIETQDGASLNVTLIPVDGDPSSGSRLSLPAMRQLGLDLTDLPTIAVFSG